MKSRAKKNQTGNPKLNYFFFALTQHPHYRNDEMSTQRVLEKSFVFRKPSYVAVSSITEPTREAAVLSSKQ